MSDHDDLDRHYAAALDEIFALRAILAYEARVTEAHLGLKTFPKSRRPYAERQVERMQVAARGDARTVYAQIPYAKRYLSLVDAPDTLTRASWEARPHQASARSLPS